MTHVLVTGATGFIGRHILTELVERGLNVSIVVRRNAEVPDGVTNVFHTENVFCSTAKFWDSACRDASIFLHNAWYVKPGKYLNSMKNLNCMTGSLRIAELVAKAGISRFVGVGTCFEYDLSHGYLQTSTPLRPSSVYGASKAGTFLALSQALPKVGVSFAWCRPFYVYGDGQDPRCLAAYIRTQLVNQKFAVLTHGNQVRDYLEVGEVARQIVEVTLSKIEGAVNICSGSPITVRDFALKIAEKYGSSDLLRFGALTNDETYPPCVFGKPTFPLVDKKQEVR